MRQLIQLFDQARLLFSAMPFASRLLAGLLVVVIVISSVFLVKTDPANSSAYLFDGYRFSETELRRAEMAFSAAGLTGSERESGRLRIPINKREAFLKALAEAKAFPQDLGSHLEEVFEAQNPFESARQFQAKTMAARERDIALALKTLPFIEFAYVSYDEQRQGFADSSQKTAAVWIMPEGQSVLTNEQKRAIAKQVQASFAGLVYENVHVMDLKTGSDFCGKNDPIAENQERIFSIKQHEETSLKSKILSLLSSFGDVRVEVNVEFDPAYREEIDKIEYNSSPLANSEDSSQTDIETKNDDRLAHTPNVQLNPSSSLKIFPRDRTPQPENIARRETKRTEKNVMLIESVSASISIPRSYYRIAYSRHWADLNPGKSISESPPISAEELRNIQLDTAKKIEHLLSGVMLKPSKDNAARIIISDYHDEQPTAAPEPTFAETAWEFVQSSWQMLSLVGIALLALLVLRSALASPIRSFDSDLIDSLEIASGEKNTTGRETRPNYFESEEWESEPSEETSLSIDTAMADAPVVDELTSLVKDNPKAGTLLRDWIREAA
jgi:flagellar M-ring protein FliF